LKHFEAVHPGYFCFGVVTMGYLRSGQRTLAAPKKKLDFQMHWLALFDHSNCTVY
jgi:hypothetical protein